MSTYTLFPGITPTGKDHIPRYRQMDWDQLRVYVSGLQDVSAKQKREEIISDLDAKFDCDNLADYATDAWDMSLDEYTEEFDVTLEDED